MSAGWADLDLRPVPGEPGRFTTTISPTWQLAVEHPDGMLDVAGPIVLRDTMPSSVGQKLGPDTGPWFAPSVDYTLHVFGPAAPGWLMAHQRARHAGDGYASIDLALWDPSHEGGGPPSSWPTPPR